MEYTKMLLLQVLLAGAALAQPQLLGQNAFQHSLRQQQPQLQQQPFQPLPIRSNNGFQQLQQQPIRTVVPAAPATGFRTQQVQQQVQQQPQTFGEGVETFKLINTRTQEPAEPAQQTRTFATPTTRPFAEPIAFQQQQRVVPKASFAPAPAPVELPNAVLAPVQQHDAQVFQRRPIPAAPTQAVLPKANTEFQQFKQPARQTQQDFRRVQPQQQNVQQFQQQEVPRFQQQQQQDFTQQLVQTQQDFQDFTQEDAVVRAPAPAPAPAPVPQVTRTRAQTRRPVAETVTRTAAAPLRVSPIRVDAAPVQQVNMGDPQEDELFREQAQNAKYTFASSVDDKLTDNSQLRQETRDGLNLAGLYSYSDGFFRRTVHYEADENGYRVTKEEVEPIGDGPQPNPNGAAEVQSQISGVDSHYRITADDIKERKKEDSVQQRFRQDDSGRF